MPEQKYYAVRTGRTPGIYESWQDCREQVNGYSGAVFKSFSDRSAAEAFLQTQEGEREPINGQRPTAYIDGSYSPKNKLYGYGGFILFNGKTYIVQGTGQNPAYMAERNIAGELLGTLAVMYKAQQMDIPEINIVFDYAGIENYAAGSWKAKTPLAQHYCQYMQLLADHYIKPHFYHVKGHSGTEGNEIADCLAKEAVGVQLRKKDIEALRQFREKAGGGADGSFHGC